MRIRLASASTVEMIVTLGAGVLMTLAGLAMVADIVAIDGANAFATTTIVASPSVTPSG